MNDTTLLLLSFGVIGFVLLRNRPRVDSTFEGRGGTKVRFPLEVMTSNKRTERRTDLLGTIFSETAERIRQRMREQARREQQALEEPTRV